MKLYVVRHGQTECNLNHIMQGFSDIELNDNGLKQAKELSLSLKNIDFDLCFTSPLKRAIDTLKIITEQQYLIDNRLIERNIGLFEMKKSNLYDRELYWNLRKNSNEAGVERVKDVFNRVQSFLDEIKIKYSDKTILIVSHDAPIRALNYIIKGFDDNTNFLDFKIENCHVIEYEI